ncbi:MAG: hypothetical protein ACYSWO_12800 [Planctomycetota bacterium]|jgi:hypothetical protein
MRETKLTRLLDFLRYLIEIAGTVTVLYFPWVTVHWLSALILAIPVFLAVSGLVDLLTFPLYLLTPEQKALLTVLNAIDKGDFSTALRVLKAHEN